ncbi:MAG: hypothetical protein LBR58_09830 [Propionibacteriaceae bacterium]|jgi:hypothetical protein|nr:hypothetical protein [Propionibacteriaceae bacterium]
MGLLDKISSTAKGLGESAMETAKGLGEKATDAVEIRQLSVKIAEEQKKIADATAEIGAFYVAKHNQGGPDDPGVAAFFTSIDAAKAEIAKLEAEIEKVKTT